MGGGVVVVGVDAVRRYGEGHDDGRGHGDGRGFGEIDVIENGICEEEMMCMMSHIGKEKPLLLWWLGNEHGEKEKGWLGDGGKSRLLENI